MMVPHYLVLTLLQMEVMMYKPMNLVENYKSEVKIGDVLTTVGGEKVRVKNLVPD